MALIRAISRLSSRPSGLGNELVARATRGHVFGGNVEGCGPGIFTVGDRLPLPVRLGAVVHEQAAGHGGSRAEHGCFAAL